MICGNGRGSLKGAWEEVITADPRSARRLREMEVAMDFSMSALKCAAVRTKWRVECVASLSTANRDWADSG